MGIAESFSRLNNRVKLLKSYLKGETYLEGRPTNIIVEATAKCNLSCPMCPRDEWEFPPRDISLDLFRRVVDSGREFLEMVTPYGIGEPMLHPQLFEMIRHCKDHGISAGISTNATILNEERGRRLLESGLDYLIFAFDGTTPEVYEKYRKGANFYKVRQNILDFLRLKKAMNSHIFCIVQMVKLPENQYQIRDFFKMWNIEGVDAIRIKQDEVHTLSTVGQEVAPPPPRKNPCHILWKGPLYARFDGKIFPCCYSYRSEPVGDIQENSLVQIWNSERMMKLREAHVKGDVSEYPDCVNCHAARPRRSIIVGSFILEMLRVRKLIPFFEKLSALYRLSIFEG